MKTFLYIAGAALIISLLAGNLHVVGGLIAGIYLVKNYWQEDRENF